MAYLELLGENGTLTEVFSAFPKTSRSLLQHHEALMRTQTGLSPAEKEMLAAYTSALNDCNYCYGIHRQTAKSNGMDPQVLDAVIAGPDDAPVSEQMRALLKYVGKLTLKPYELTQADAHEALAAGCTQEQLFDAVSVAALFNLMNRLVSGLGIDREDDYLELAGRRLHDIGYDGLAASLGL